MNNEILNNSLLNKIFLKIPQKTQVAHTLADLLNTDTESIYKKLKGEEAFTFHEAMIISKRLKINLNTLKMDKFSMPKQPKSKIIEYVNPVELDFTLLKELTVILSSLQNIPDAYGGEITNILPQPLYLSHKNIFRFDLFRWKYQSNDSGQIIGYKDIVIADELQKAMNLNVKCTKCLHTDYIFDKQVFLYLITDIRYFYSVGLITYDEVQLIKQELLKIVDEIDILTQTGFFEETGKKINIYLSNVKIDTSYIFIDVPDFQLTIIKTFILNGIATTDKKTFEEVKKRVQSIKQQSILITGSSEKERVNFLEEQRGFIEALSQI